MKGMKGKRKECSKQVAQGDGHSGEGRSWSDQNPYGVSKEVKYNQ